MASDAIITLILQLADLPEWDWYDISAHLRCTQCGSVGFVETRLDWGEVINLEKAFADVNACKAGVNVFRTTCARVKPRMNIFLSAYDPN
jgi:hypothetical protein